MIDESSYKSLYGTIIRQSSLDKNMGLIVFIYLNFPYL